MFTSRSNKKSSEIKTNIISKTKLTYTNPKIKPAKEIIQGKHILKFNDIITNVKKNPSENLLNKNALNTIIKNIKPNSKSNSNISEVKRLSLKGTQSPIQNKIFFKKETLLSQRGVAKNLCNKNNKNSHINGKTFEKKSNKTTTINYNSEINESTNLLLSPKKLTLSNPNNGLSIKPSPQTERMRILDLNLDDNIKVESDVISSIRQLSNLLNDSNKNLTTYEQLLTNEEDINKLKTLNEILNKLNLNAIKILSHLINDKNEAKDNKLSLCLDLNENVNNKDLISDIYLNSDIRIKRYGVLLEFLTNNFKEIKELLIKSSKVKSDMNTLPSQINCIEKNNKKMFSSFSLLNSTIKKEVKDTIVCDFNESELEEVNDANMQRDHKFNKINELSLIISTISSENYIKILEDSRINNINNFSCEGNLKDKENLENTFKNFFSSISNLSCNKDYSDTSHICEYEENKK